MGAVVRLIRRLDRRGGLASRRGEQAYDRVSGLFGGLHRRVVRDAEAFARRRSDGGAGVTIIDVGSGPGRVLGELRARLPGARLVGVEPSATMRELAAARGVETVDGRAEALPFDDGSVDLAVSSLAAHHWDDPVAGFRELWRVLCPGGEAWVYDVRFAGFTDAEVRPIAAAAGLPDGAMGRIVLDERVLGLRPYAVIRIRR